MTWMISGVYHIHGCIAVGYSNGDVRFYRWIRQNSTQNLVLHDRYYNMILSSI